MTTQKLGTPPARGRFHRASISVIISFVIVFMAVANGIFTYAGAYLYLEEQLYALLFAIAVQFTIAATLIALPFVHGFGKLSLITVYIAALVLSTLSAYTYIYNSSMPGEMTVYTIDTELKSKITNDLSDVIFAEEKVVGEALAATQEAKRLVDEEGAQGGRSGLGPGKGEKYYAKLDAYQTQKTRYDHLAKNLNQAQTQLDKINGVLANKSTDFDRDQLLVDFSRLRASVNSPESRDIIESISKSYIGNLQNPVERAVSALMEDRSQWSIQLIVSIIWAAVFDIIALFLGIIRYYLLRPEHSMLKGIYNSFLEIGLFGTRLKNLRKEVALRYHKEQGIRQYDNEMPLNSTEIQAFATKLMAGSQLAMPLNDDPGEPLNTLVGLIEPLDIEDDDHAVGIPFVMLEDEPRLKTLLAMLIQTKVFLKNTLSQCYILNSDEKMSQKVMIFIRMGMKEDIRDMSPVKFLVDQFDEQFEQAASRPALGQA